MDRKLQSDKLKIQPSNDRKLIENLFFDKELYSGFVSNKDIKKEQIKLDMIKDKFFILYCDKNPIGLCIFYPIKDKICVVHIGIKNQYRGKIAYKFGEMLKEALFKKFLILTAQIRKENKKALYYAIQLGFKLFGGNETYKFLGVNYG